MRAILRKIARRPQPFFSREEQEKCFSNSKREKFGMTNRRRARYTRPVFLAFPYGKDPFGRSPTERRALR
jgi:hypothetical protein